MEKVLNFAGFYHKEKAKEALKKHEEQELTNPFKEINIRKL